MLCFDNTHPSRPRAFNVSPTRRPALTTDREEPSTAIAQITLTTGTAEYLHTDLTGSVRAVTDSTGALVARTDYSTYGTPQSVTATDGSTLPAVATLTSFGYAGEYTDPTGLIYLRARWYDPNTAVLLSIDPLVDHTRNAYGYTGGNPLQYGDPLGLSWWNPLTWTGATYDNIALSATALELTLQLPSVAAAATGVGLPETGVLEVAATTLGVVASTASALGAVQHFSAGETEAGWISVMGAIPLVGLGARAMYVTRYAPRIAEAGYRTYGSVWRKVAQGVETGSTWGNGLGVWLQDLWSFSDWSRSDMESLLPESCGQGLP